MSWHLFIDESGDLGFDFDNTSCSRFLTVSVLAVSQLNCVKSIRTAVRKTLARKINLGKRGRNNPVNELKGTKTSLGVKEYFYRLIADQRFGIYAITLDKRQVKQDCSTPELKHRMYNYVANKAISSIPFEHATPTVDLIIDRSKGKKETAIFNEYLVTQLAGQLHPRTVLEIRHRNSTEDMGLSAADLFCWGIFHKAELGDSSWYDMYAEKVRLNETYQ